jgi:S1-C subfamily serine protease
MNRKLLIGSVCIAAGILIGRMMSADHPLLNLGAGEAHAAPGVFSNDQSSTPAEMTPEERINVSVYEHSNPSVVNINTKSVQIDNFFMLQREMDGSGSGAVLDKNGHILTNMHVVEDADDIQVTLASHKNYPAVLVGADKEQDIAVLRIDAPPEELFPITMGRSDNLRVGQKVFVLGNPFGWDQTMTTGIISSLNRDLPSRVPDRDMQALIQTDAAMNPGNSGGPMLDSNSRMIGMCVAIATKTGQNSGVGFAIPIDRIKRIVPELITNGRIVKADIGITHVMETESGLVVARVAPDGPAARAGLEGFRRVVQRRQQGPVVYETETIDRSHADRILAVNGEPMRSGVQFRDKIWEYRPGDVVQVTIERDGRQMNVPVTLGSN